ncbi:MAG: hypothetical protein AAF917_02380, partial [Pseudomonadota bacterium]
MWSNTCGRFGAFSHACSGAKSARIVGPPSRLAWASLVLIVAILGTGYASQGQKTKERPFIHSTGENVSLQNLCELPQWRRDDCADPENLREIRYAKTTWRYAIIAALAYAPIQQGSEPLFESNRSAAFGPLANWEKLETSDAVSETEGWPTAPAERGLYAESWLIPDQGGGTELVVAFRGTEFSQLADWIYGNFAFFPLRSWRDQYDLGVKYATRQVDQY